MPMPGRTRVCANCRTITATEETTSCTYAGRVFYYCASCRSNVLYQCRNCLCIRQTRRDPPYNLGTDYLHAVGLTAQTAVTPGREPFSTGRSICAACHSMLSTDCPGCGSLVMRHVTNGHPVCLTCAASTTVCIRCKQKKPTTTVANEFTSLAGHAFCRSCVTKPMPDTTFIVNRSKRLVGYEIECFLARPASLEGYGLVKGDGSLHPRESDPIEGASGWEFNSFPARGDAVLTSVVAVTDILKRATAFVNVTCGLHIHLDMAGAPSVELDNICFWWEVLEPIFFRLVDKSRQNNIFCRSIKDRQRERYTSLNPASLRRHGTYEIRLHHGTVDPTTINRWILVLLSFFDTFQQIPVRSNVHFKSDREMLLFFFQQCRVPLSIRKYMVRSMRRLGPIAHKNESQPASLSLHNPWSPPTFAQSLPLSTLDDTLRLPWPWGSGSAPALPQEQERAVLLESTLRNPGGSY